jgi:hypothetical protein
MTFRRVMRVVGEGVSIEKERELLMLVFIGESSVD